MRRILLLALLALVFAALPARSIMQQDWYAKAVRGVSAKFDPAEAQPGQTVTFSLTVELNEGYFTYPLVQKDKACWYVDTHAGAGGYALDDAFARQNAEFDTGIARLWPERERSPAPLRVYLDAVAAVELRLGNAAAITAAADDVGRTAKDFAEKADGNAIDPIDSMLPKPSDYNNPLNEDSF